jgi:hypothetical protein
VLTHALRRRFHLTPVIEARSHVSHITDRSGFVMHRGRIVKPTMCQSAMKAVAFVDRMFMTIEAGANHYGVVVRSGFEHSFAATAAEADVNQMQHHFRRLQCPSRPETTRLVF